AEDGIRDLIVTGVQTCALPIWATPSNKCLQPAAAGAICLDTGRCRTVVLRLGTRPVRVERTWRRDSLRTAGMCGYHGQRHHRSEAPGVLAPVPSSIVNDHSTRAESTTTSK